MNENLIIIKKNIYSISVPVDGQSGQWARVVIKIPDQKKSTWESISIINQPVYIKKIDLGKFITTLAHCPDCPTTGTSTVIVFFKCMHKYYKILTIDVYVIVAL
jgi:hypothetical protein